MKDMKGFSNHSDINHQGRKGRLLSVSSKSGLNLKEFSRLKFENERYKYIIQEMVDKFLKFKKSLGKQSNIIPISLINTDSNQN